MRTVGHGDCPEREPVERAHDGEEKKGACADISGEEDEEYEETDGEHLAAVESVDDKSAERTHHKGRDHIS